MIGFISEPKRGLMSKTVTVLSGLIRPLVENRLPDWVEPRFFASKEEALELADADGATKDGAEGEKSTDDPSDAHWLARNIVRRGLYHSGADLVGCSQQDHAH